MQAIVDDLLAESQSLDALLSKLSADQWHLPTPAAGWDVRDSVAHIALGNELAEECARTGKSTLIEQVMQAGSFEEFEASQVARGRAKSPDEVLGWWRATVGPLADALRAVDPATRIPWGPTTMGAVSFATARLMETWAHGLDVYDGVGITPVDTERLQHIAFLGLRSLPYAFAMAQLPAPGPVRLELSAPDGSTWRLGADDAPTVITGSAADWCRAAVHRDRRGERARLRSTGPDGEIVIATVKAFLG